MLKSFFKHYFDELRVVPPKIFYFRGFLVHIWEKVHKLDNIWHWTQNGIYYGVLIYLFFPFFLYQMKFKTRKK